ncbi:U-box domain-containing protein 44-like [Hibiscus syriacus]|uniref:U-box domain-containing protein 44-like n=1 Tax=Hibiscus syriacus TaxID=106335 RepID=UPI001923909D|nr:U-box domain-containing protein 44-like [Hibiscus syriacus]XP_039000092.1 U-box domain-containing protein 44-like [Hibiscus syriacus]XP_039000093.1 U-box domain-containing protein 44-like [Hibiscus syriacus]XP_039000094.1 U-box domain-containing protein 44-like [Hibiscus syriacus]XP_039000095.1 U-box domain-containing protein 44-like [Hibiscus syriacus]
MVMELIPIGTILAVVTNQVIKTAQAAKDIVIEKESFKVLSKYLFDIEPVLKELQLRQLNDSQTARLALEALEADVKKANNLVEKYKNRGRFYLLVKCRHIVNEVQEVTRDIGRSLAAFSLVNTEILSGISDQVNRLQSEMQKVEFETSHSQLQIVDRLNQGLRDQKRDQCFANDMLEEIARAVGVPVEPSEINKELASFRREIEEAGNRKERAEVFFLEQVIELLSQADAARDYEEMKKQYFQRAQVIERYDTQKEYIPPLKPFICRISGEVMDDPVSLCTGTTCERAAIEARFDCGMKTDPETGDVLEDTSLRSNLPLRQSIDEWRELNYCLKIRASQAKLSSGVDSKVVEALNQMQDLIRENSINKDWISIGGLTDSIISILGSSRNREVKKKIFITLKDMVEGHARNKEKVIEQQGFDYIVPCLGRDPSISMAAVELLYELLQDRSKWNVCFCRQLSLQSSAILFLVTLLKGPVRQSADYAEKILNKLFDVDEDNISRAAKSGWYYKPLIDRIVQGPVSSRMSMLKALVIMDLYDSNLKVLGEEGIIPPLLSMVASGNIELKELSLSVLVKLSGCRANKELIAAGGGVPVVLKLMFSSHVCTIHVVKCSEIVEKLSSEGDGVKFFVDENGVQLELEPIITQLLALQQNTNSSNNFRKPALRALLGICRSEARLIKTAVLTANGVSLVLPLLDDPDSEVREIAVSLLFLFSQQESQGVIDYLLKPKRLEGLVGFLENDCNIDVKMAAAGLLANLPKSEVSLTKKLIELDGLPAIINLLRSGTMEAREQALSALFRFTDPANVESQRIVVEHGSYPLLVNFLKVGSVTAKARAAALIGYLSMSSPKLTVASERISCWCFRISRLPVCPAHGGICKVNTSFCLLEANSLPYIVNLLHDKVEATAYEAIQTLSTLVQDGCLQRGAVVLHEARAIEPVLDILTWGTDSLKEAALGLLEKVFASKEMVETYGTNARYLLVGLTGGNVHGDHPGRKVAKVLSLLDRYSKSSTSIIPGLF